MAELNKTQIKPLYDKSDYNIWRTRVYTAISTKGLWKVFETKKIGEASGSTTTGTGCEASVEQCQKTRNKIVSPLSDPALRAVQSEIGNHMFMMANLNDPYDSERIASRMSRMSELVSLKSETLRD